jgi:hypothetical protein
MSVLEMDNDRKLFTNHGLCLNTQGKALLCKIIVSHAYSVLEQKIDPPLILNEIRTKPNSSTKPGKSYKQNIYYVDQGRLLQ